MNGNGYYNPNYQSSVYPALNDEYVNSMPRGYNPPQSQPYQNQASQFTNNVAQNQYFQNQRQNYPQQPTYNQYPQQQQQYNGYCDNLSSQMGGLSVTQQGFNRLWGSESIDLLRTLNILPPGGLRPPEIKFQQEYMKKLNCSPEIFRCTLTKIPETKGLLQKSRLPLGILIHPFKDLVQLPVIQCSTIVRCRACRTYINPFIYFVDNRRWKCNLCFRINDVPEEFSYDPITKTYGDPSRRPEVKSSTIEFIAPADYMVRPPQAATYLFLLDTSSIALETGYLKIVCESILESLDRIPGDTRTKIGFISYDRNVKFYNLAEGMSTPGELIVCDIDDIFIPRPEDLVVSLSKNINNIKQFLTYFANQFMSPEKSHSTRYATSCLGAALQAAEKLLGSIGGRITVFQCTLPNIGPGSLDVRNNKTSKDLTNILNPATDFYKKLALSCSSSYIAVDLFFLSHSYVDIATISCISKFSGGCVYYIPNFSINSNTKVTYFENLLNRYLTRKIGFEAVMRVRCSSGMSIHTFHGNLFVRSTDLLSLPNCNPDAGFGMQVSIDEDLTNYTNVCFQAALLYTSSKGERRIRVHTLCIPVSSSIPEIISSVDQSAMIGLLTKMAVDKSLSANLQDARECCINATLDALSAYASFNDQKLGNLSLLAPNCLALLPLYIHSVLRSPAFSTKEKIDYDMRTYWMNNMKTLPLATLIQSCYPDLYPLHNVLNCPCNEDDIPELPLLQLCSNRIDSNGVFIMDTPEVIYIYVCRYVAASFCKDVFNVNCFEELSIEQNELFELENPASTKTRNFVLYLQSLKPFFVPLIIMKEDSKRRNEFTGRLVEDRGEDSVSYYEFLQTIKNQVK